MHTLIWYGSRISLTASNSDLLKKQQGIYGDPTSVPPGPGRGSDMYRGDLIVGSGSGYTMAGSWGPPDPQPLHYSGYNMVSYVPRDV